MGTEERIGIRQQGQIVAPQDQLILLMLDSFFKSGDIVEVREDPDERFLRINKPGKATQFSIYKDLIKIL